MFYDFYALLKRNRREESGGIKGSKDLVGAKLNVFSEFDEIVRIFAGERRVFQKSSKNRNEEAGEALLWATAVRDDVACRVLFVGFVGFDERV